MPKTINLMLATLALWLPALAAAADETTPWQPFRTTLRQAAVAEHDIGIIVRQIERRGMATTEAASWAAILLRIRQAGLPVGPGVDRLEQGLAKNIPPGAISRALETLYKDLEWGKRLVDEAQGAGAPPEPAARVAAIVENLEVAVRQDFDRARVAEAITRAGPGIERIGLMTEAMTSWNAYGIEPGFVLASFGEMLDDGTLSYDNLAYLNRLVEDDVAQGRGVEAIRAVIGAEIHNMKESLDIRNTPGAGLRQQLGKQAPMSGMDDGLGIGNHFLSPAGTGVGGGGGGGSGGAVLSGGSSGTGMMGGGMGCRP